MHCTKCGSEHLKVLDSRPSPSTNAIRRRRECEDCSNRFTTFERMEEQPIVVMKKNGQKEPFDRQKLMRGLITATVKRGIEMNELDKLIDEVQQYFSDQDRQEITSFALGEEVLKRLTKLDSVASIRFASVYKQFETPEEFNDELRRLTHAKH